MYYIFCFSLFYCFAFILSENANCQSQKIIVVDSISYKAIPSVAFISGNETIYSDKNGSVPKCKLKDQAYQLNHISYESKKVSPSQDLDTIFLLPKSYILKEVTINSKKKKTYELGYHRSGILSVFNLNFLYPYTFSGFNKQQIAVFIPHDGKYAKIEEILLEVGIADRNTGYIVHLYKVKNNGEPGEAIFSRLIIPKDLKNHNKIDVSSLNLEIPTSGIFIGFEWLDQANNEKNFMKRTRVAMTSKIDTCYTYIYSGHEEQYYWLKYGELFEGVEDLNKNINARFGLKMRYY